MIIKPAISFDLDGTLIYQDQNRKLGELIKIAEGCGYRVSAESLRTAKEIANQFYDVVAHRFSGKTTELWYHYAEVMTIYGDYFIQETLSNKVIQRNPPSEAYTENHKVDGLDIKIGILKL